MIMIINLFSPFDVNLTQNFIPLTWPFIVIILIRFNLKTFNNIKLNSLIKLFSSKSINPYNPRLNSIILLITSTLTLVLILNSINLIPFYMSPTRNLIFNLSLTITLWRTNYILLTINNKNIIFINLTPSNTPTPLIIIINIIELNRFFFQIISLSIRLTINIIIGHIIISISQNFYLSRTQLTIETFIIIIQSYVFFILNLLNFNNSF